MKVRSEERMVINSPFRQGEDEAIRREILVPVSWGESPFSALSTVIKEYDSDTEDFIDVTIAKTSGVTTAVDNRIRTPEISGLENGKIYIVEIKFTAASGARLECWLELRGEE